MLMIPPASVEESYFVAWLVESPNVTPDAPNVIAIFNSYEYA
jgi:hypothetical protein